MMGVIRRRDQTDQPRVLVVLLATKCRSISVTSLITSQLCEGHNAIPEAPFNFELAHRYLLSDDLESFPHFKTLLNRIGSSMSAMSSVSNPSYSTDTVILSSVQIGI
jgi:hypothetical protein